MPFKKPGQLADETFEATYLQDAFDGVMNFLEENNVPEGNNDPETIIIIRNNILGPGGSRTFTGGVYVGKTIDDIIKNDLK